jgi:hypothetical protein
METKTYLQSFARSPKNQASVPLTADCGLIVVLNTDGRWLLRMNGGLEDLQLSFFGCALLSKRCVFNNQPVESDRNEK